jgi:CRP/FNR family cyclic AMP-dependent transcriptional regulator
LRFDVTVTVPNTDWASARDRQVNAGSQAKVRFGTLLSQRAARTPELDRLVKVSAGAPVYLPGERGEHVYVVERGWVKTEQYSAEGRACLIDLLGRGEVFGEECLVSRSRTHAAVTGDEAVLRVMRRDHFLRCLSTLELGAQWTTYLGERMRDHQALIFQYGTMDSEQRLAMRLAWLAREIDRGTGGMVHLPYRITHEEFAAMIGTTRSRVGLFLRRFETLGMVVRDQRTLIVNMARLQHYLEIRGC